MKGNKRKIIVLAIMGIFLLTVFSTLSAKEIEANGEKHISDTEIFTTKSDKNILIGSVTIISDGTYDGTTVVAQGISNPYNVDIDGPSTVRFYIKYHIKNTGDNLFIAKAGFNGIVVSPINPGIELNHQGEYDDQGEIFSKEIDVDIGDRFRFELHGLYMGGYPEIFSKVDGDLVKGKFIDEDKSRSKSDALNNPIVSQFGKLINLFYNRFSGLFEDSLKFLPAKPVT